LAAVAAMEQTVDAQALQMEEMALLVNMGLTAATHLSSYMGLGAVVPTGDVAAMEARGVTEGTVRP